MSFHPKPNSSCSRILGDCIPFSFPWCLLWRAFQAFLSLLKTQVVTTYKANLLTICIGFEDRLFISRYLEVVGGKLPFPGAHIAT